MRSREVGVRCGPRGNAGSRAECFGSLGTVAVARVLCRTEAAASWSFSYAGEVIRNRIVGSSGGLGRACAPGKATSADLAQPGTAAPVHASALARRPRGGRAAMAALILPQSSWQLAEVLYMRDNERAVRRSFRAVPAVQRRPQAADGHAASETVSDADSCCFGLVVKLIRKS